LLSLDASGSRFKRNHLVDARSVNESTENDELTGASIAQGVVISWLDITALSKEDCIPCLGLAVINKDFSIAVITFQATVKENLLLINYRASVMRDLAWAFTVCLDALPLDWIVRILLKSMDSC
jgi:hypothetical protein